ncbi:transcription elongation factor 1 homolog [Paramacrobiotus metropolitanus]|uniref:transcription elongation factor 1 homolog n=1 Tax=Paramacrobiotus metropolitanus TaxID=2943436 RepID=UPI002446008B|nr:transcription elongation factor 1 homolog [Paramacrobiotus metropolitanus]
MGKRKSKRKPPAKRKQLENLATMFNCPFCNHERSCEVKLDRERNTGTVKCNVCSETYQCQIHALMEAIDVYNEWIDACEAVNA